MRPSPTWTAMARRGGVLTVPDDLAEGQGRLHRFPSGGYVLVVREEGKIRVWEVVA